MYIENPNKKETYSFRVKPDLLKNIKLYAQATNQTVPEILNELIEETVDGLHLTNDYLENNIDTNSIIGLPPLEDIYNNGRYKEFGLFFETENRVFYEIQRVPNNLDIWRDKEGYTSNKRGVDHEGISFVLAPELINNPDYLTNPELMFCCFVPIYFRISIKKRSIQVKNLNFDDTLKKIKNSPNMELLDKFTKHTNEVKKIIYKYSNIAKNGYGSPDNQIRIFNKLRKELLELCKSINTNIISQEDGAINRQKQRAESYTLQTDNPYILLNEIDKLREENKELKTQNEEITNKVTELGNELDEIKKFWLKISTDEEARTETWENLKNK